LASLNSFKFGSLWNTGDRTQVPDGFCYRMSNATCLDNIGEGCPRYGDKWSRVGADPDDVGYGAFYAEFNGTSEFIAILKRDGDSTARLYSVNPSTGVFTAVTRNGSDALDPSMWTFAQYEDRIYALNEEDGMWVRRIGGAIVGGDADDDWKEMKPEFVRGSQLNLSTERPPYEAHTWPGGTTVEVVHSDFGESHTILVDAAPDANNRIRLHPREEVPARWDADAYVVITLPAALDLSEVDHVGIWFTGGQPRPPLDVTSETSRIMFAVTEDVGSSVTYDWVQSLTKARAVTLTEGVVDSEWWLYADFSNVADADKNAVRRIVIGIQVQWNWDFTLYIQEVRFGGKRLLEGRASEFAIPYAFAYYNPTTKQLSPAIQTDLPIGDGDGAQSSSFLEKLGAWVLVEPSVDSGLNGAGYTKIRVYRKDCFPPTGSVAQWHYLGEVDNTGTPSYRDSATETELRLKDTVELRFEPFEADLQPQALWVWKQHLVLALKTRLFFSFAGRPNMFLPPPEDNVGLPDEDQFTLGRTVYLSEGRTEPARGAAAQDLLYMFSPRGTFVMIGDSANGFDTNPTTPPRLLPGSRGVCGKRASSVWQSGVVAGWRDGLWYSECSRAFSGSIDQTYQQQNLTADVSASWKNLFGTDGSGMVVTTFDDNLWIFNGTKYMRLTNIVQGERNWEEGTWPTVAAAMPVHGLGLYLQLGDGSIVRVFEDANGDKYLDDLGSEVNWQLVGGYEVGPRRQPLKLFAVCEGTPTITVDLIDGAKGTNQVIWEVVEDSFWSKNLNVNPGAVIGITIDGVTGRDKVKILQIESEEFEDKVN